MRFPYSMCLVACWLLFAAQLGCVSWRSLQPVPASVSAGRRLARQGVAAIEVGQWDEAERLLREAVEKSPDDPESRRHLAEALQRRGASSEALEHMAVAASLDASDPPTAVRAGELLLEAGDTRRALQQANQAIRLDNSLASAWRLRGRAHAANGNLDRALADMQRALLLTPNETKLLLETANLYHQCGQLQQCLSTLHRLHDTTGPGSETAEMLELEGSTYLALGRTQMAIERLSLAAKRGSSSTELPALLAEAKEKAHLEVSQASTGGAGQLR